MALRDLYQEIILDHGKFPRNFGKLACITHSHFGNNPLCGDKLIVYVHKSNQCLEAVYFEGQGCMICIASASLMTETVKGKTLNEFQQLFESFHQLVTGGEVENPLLGKLSALSGVSEFPIRVKCATLAWHTLRAALEKAPSPVTTE